MTVLEIVTAAELAGFELSVTDTGKLRCTPTPLGELREAIKANVAAILTVLRDSDGGGWRMPSSEAMEAARKARREALYVPPRIDLDRPGLGQQFREEMRRLSQLGLVLIHPGDAVSAEQACQHADGKFRRQPESDPGAASQGDPG